MTRLSIPIHTAAARAHLVDKIYPAANPVRLSTAKQTRLADRTYYDSMAKRRQSRVNTEAKYAFVPPKGKQMSPGQLADTAERLSKVAT